ncbi:putative heterokaryon incompatibility protein [Rosellinia necatrix]|uniref:Putative heterokaryon incompatibility protein n=1 Tax=Rosellinia necatrix TaxID=77044 RepID=A0A1W2TFX4_ROSNE|nr:putative heterokaryon incompatibility protein [Rosellinia necatrix]
MYTYRPLQEQKEFRLLKLLPGGPDEAIQCALSHESLEQPPPYYAVSYTWGSPDVAGEVTLDGCAVPVRENLHQFLRHVRDPGASLALWVDALCIDQGSIPERNRQVPLMGEIYARARTVLVWLGAHADGSERFFDAVAARDPARVDARDAADRLYARPYWARAWIVQEVVLAADLRMLCGDRACDWADLHLWGGRLRTPNDPAAADHAFVNVVALRQAGTITKLRRLLFRFHETRCADPRDRVYSLLGFAEDTRGGDGGDAAHGIVVDYACPIEALFVQTLAFCSGLSCRSLLSNQSAVECLRFCDTLATRLGAELEPSLRYAADALRTRSIPVLVARLTQKAYFANLKRLARLVPEPACDDPPPPTTTQHLDNSRRALARYSIRSVLAKGPLSLWSFDRFTEPSHVVFAVDLDSPNEPRYQLCCICKPNHHDTDADGVKYYRYHIAGLGIVPDQGGAAEAGAEHDDIYEKCAFVDGHLRSLDGLEVAESLAGFMLELTLQELVGICQFARITGVYLPWALSEASPVDHWQEPRDIFSIWK